jgi:hypothetical protein
MILKATGSTTVALCATTLLDRHVRLQAIGSVCVAALMLIEAVSVWLIDRLNWLMGAKSCWWLGASQWLISNAARG